MEQRKRHIHTLAWPEESRQCGRSAGFRKDPTVAQKEIEQRTAKDCDCVRSQDRQVRPGDEQAHERQVAEQRDKSVREMKAKKLGQDRALHASPGEAKMPDEIVQQSELQCSDGGEKIVTTEAMVEESKRSELNDDSDRPDEIEFEPAGESGSGFHGSGSSL